MFLTKKLIYVLQNEVHPHGRNIILKNEKTKITPKTFCDFDT